MNIILYMFLILMGGSSYLAVHYVVAAFPPLFGAMVRIGTATLLITLYAWRTKNLLWPRGRLALLCMITGLMTLAIPSSLIFWGQTKVAPALAAIILCSAPLFTVIALPFFDRKMATSIYQKTGVLLGFSGITLTFLPKIQRSAHAELLGLFAILGAAISFGIVTAILQPLTQKVKGPVLLVYQGIPAFFVLVLLSRLAGPWPSWSFFIGETQALVALGYLAVVLTVVGYIVWFHLIKTLGSITTATAAYFNPLVAILLDIIILHHSPNWQAVTGTIIIICGVALTKYKPRARTPIPFNNPELP